MTRALRRLAIGIGALVTLLALAVAGTLWWSLPGSGLSADIPGLSAPVHIALDEDGIPRIRAATALDGAAALGFMHARDRMFQLEMTRRVASGTLAEVAGGTAVPIDRVMRTLGLRRQAEAELAGLDPDTRAMLDAYARGVNAWIARRGRFAAPELILLGAPAPWTPVDSLLWGKTMALYLAGNWRQEMLRATLLRRLPPERVRALWPEQADTPGPDAAVAASTLLAAIPAFPAPFTLPDQASNEWAVDGAHSTTGAPLLAGDPHLAYGMPAIWYLARIDTPGSVLAGATAPGVPFLVIGHNGHIAWTFTTAGADTQDVFIETPMPDGGYAVPGGAAPFTSRTETIHVRFGADQTMVVRETRHGPVLSDLDAPNGPVLAVAMASLAPGDTAAQGLLELNRAETVEQAGRAAPVISAPVQNMLVADAQGIGMFTTGRVPVRKAGDGTLPVNGADGAHDWTGFASGPALPHVVNPASGELVNANERTAPPGFPVFMGQDWFGGWRAKRIRAMLDERTTQSPAGFERMQLDVTSAFAQTVLPRLLRTPAVDPASQAALALLARWNGAMRTDWPEPLLFNDWMDRFHRALLQRDDLPPGAFGLMQDAVGRALGNEEASWCGDACDAMLTDTLAAASRDFDRSILWGELHQAEFAHPLLGRLPLLGRYARWELPQPGDASTIFAGAMSLPDWHAVHGPAFRGIYDLSNLDRSVFALAPGESGHPLRRQASSTLHRWAFGTNLHLLPLDARG